MVFLFSAFKFALRRTILLILIMDLGFKQLTGMMLRAPPLMNRTSVLRIAEQGGRAGLILRCNLQAHDSINKFCGPSDHADLVRLGQSHLFAITPIDREGTIMALK
jgi:hypothetical protein